MIDRVKRLFAKDRTMRPKDRNRTQTRDIHVAICALFLEMAHIDGEFSDSELEEMIGLLKRHYHLSDLHVTELVEASKCQLAESIDLWQFTNLINQNYSRQEKIQIIEMVWQLVFADEKLDKHEDYLMHKLAKLLRLTHKELIDAKLKGKARHAG
ncbi:MAG: TerB family tellurite resistance protein [Thermodesulfobacteriota bacterium]|nr:TerB family tellurite resistance protein [Thermodesulfobacteriota bacterium]